MASCRTDQGRLRNSSAGDAAREGGAFGDDGEDRPQGCARHRAIDPDGLVSAGPLQIGQDRRKSGRCWSPANFCSENCSTWSSAFAEFCAGFGLKMGMVTRKGFEAPGSRTERWPGDAGANLRRDAYGARRLADGIHQAAQGAADDRAQRSSLPPSDDRAGRWACRRDHVQDGGRRSDADRQVEGGRRHCSG